MFAATVLPWLLLKIGTGFILIVSAWNMEYLSSDLLGDYINSCFTALRDYDEQRKLFRA